MPLSPQKTALIRAAQLCGGQAALARLLSARTGGAVSQQRVWNAVHRDRSVPGEWCLAIEEATGGKISAQALRPDLYPGEKT